MLPIVEKCQHQEEGSGDNWRPGCCDLNANMLAETETLIPTGQQYLIVSVTNNLSPELYHFMALRTTELDSFRRPYMYNTC